MRESSAQDRRSDAALIRACQQGDPEAFRHLYRRHHSLVRATLFHLCDPSTLDDLVQEVFLKAWRGINTMRQEAKFSTWLYRIAYNVGADYRRSVAKHLSKQEKAMHSDAASEAPNWQSLHHQDLVQRGLAHLRPEHAMVLILSDLEELSQTDIAQTLEIPVGTVKSRLFHARAILRRFFEQEGVSL
ncbi:sigma-70 family RNA polymerase sigma factor [Lyngbya confervoides]|uniref:Sigma-70 family RNA polymerase sigma factor n=1 Tax=Lyngbya confervoides BDU141951 TaxID=1574623 RepID=A0ABD4T0B0_9CYAN|nr:sigma-70 family RNA polymerase sigma factor [Lyngbya confervoides]MCM1982012.1 sigma-70 family RNA polymerase sigma factor [Lyngbya confervoides BDU141951]